MATKAETQAKIRKMLTNGSLQTTMLCSALCFAEKHFDLFMEDIADSNKGDTLTEIEKAQARVTLHEITMAAVAAIAMGF